MSGKAFVKKIGYAAFDILSRKTSIFFESCPDLSDNTMAVFEEMVRRGLNKKYTLVWHLFDGPKAYPKIPNVVYLRNGDPHIHRYNASARCYISCNHYLVPPRNKQTAFFLTHGMYVKRPTDYYTLPERIDYCLCSSEGLMNCQAKALNYDIAKMVPLGFPRNDVLTGKQYDLTVVFGKEYKKFIVWYPTFRQHKSGMGTGSVHAVPIIWNEENAKRLNAYAAENDTLIILKPHFAQDTSKIRNLGLDHICLINDDFFKTHNMRSYELLASCDAMITDYSSVYFDYTLCDKPIGLVWEDYDEYAKNPGFALDMDYYMKGGVKIYTVEDFAHFIKDVGDGTDRLQRERREIRDIANYSTDGKNTERVVDFIIENAKL